MKIGVLKNNRKVIYDTVDGRFLNETPDLTICGTEIQICGMKFCKWVDFEKNDYVIQKGKNKFYFCDESLELKYSETIYKAYILFYKKNRETLRVSSFRGITDITSSVFDNLYDSVDKEHFNSCFASYISLKCRRNEFVNLDEKERIKTIKKWVIHIQD